MILVCYLNILLSISLKTFSSDKITQLGKNKSARIEETRIQNSDNC